MFLRFSTFEKKRKESEFKTSVFSQYDKLSINNNYFDTRSTNALVESFNVEKVLCLRMNIQKIIKPILCTA